MPVGKHALRSGSPRIGIRVSDLPKPPTEQTTQLTEAGMTDPWKCPACGIWLSPAVTSHRCEVKAEAEGKPPEPTQPPQASTHLAGAFERQGRHDYEPAPRWGFRP